jgi:hypothetical protein
MNFYDKLFYVLAAVTFMVCVWVSLFSSGILVTLGLIGNSVYLGALIGRWLA